MSSLNDPTDQTKAYRKWQIKIFTATWLAYAGYYFCRKAFYVVKDNIAFSLNIKPLVLDTIARGAAAVAHIPATKLIGHLTWISAIDLAQLGTAYLVSYMIGQFSSAFFGRKLGPKLLLLIGMGISLTCNFVFGISNSFWTILLFIAVNGLAQGTGWPGCIGSLAFWFKRKQRGTILGFWSTCYQLGSVMATGLAAYLLGVAGWRWSFFGASAILLVIWGVVFVLHPNRPVDVGLEPLVEDDAQNHDSNKATNGSDNNSDNKKKGLGWDKNTIISILMMGAAYFSIKFLRYALWSWSPYFLKKNFGLTGSDAGYLSTVFDIAGFLGVLAAGFLSDKLFKGRRSFISFLMLVFMALAFVLMYTLGATNLFIFTLSMGIAGFMLYGPDSLLSGVGAIDVGSKKGALAAAGIINGMGSAGPIFQEEIIGWMYDKYHHNLIPILTMFMIVATAGAIIVFFLWQKSRRGTSKL